MAKPSVIAVIVGLFMLRPGWLARYIPADIQDYIPDVTWFFGFVWAGLMFVTAALNLLFVLVSRLLARVSRDFPGAVEAGLFAVHRDHVVIGAAGVTDGGLRVTKPLPSRPTKPAIAWS